MKIGFNEGTAMKNSNLKIDLELTEKYGYDYIEIRLDMLREYLKTNTLEDLKQFFKNSHLKPYALNSIEDITFCNEEELQRKKVELEWACKIAKELHNPYIVIVPTINDKVKKYTEQEAEEDSVRVLKEFADISEKYNVSLAFEPIGFEHCAVRSIQQCWNILKKVDRPSVGMVVDAFNLYLYNGLKDLQDLEKVDTEKIFIFHIDDSEAGDIRQLDQCHRVWPGDGVIPLDKLLRTLYKKGFDKIASIELFRPEYWDLPTEDIVRIGYEKTKNILEKYYK